MCLRCSGAGDLGRMGDAVRPFFLRSRNESYRLRGLPLVCTVSGFAIWIAVAIVGAAALVAYAAPRFLGLMILALMFVLAAVMVHRGMR